MGLKTTAAFEFTVQSSILVVKNSLLKAKGASGPSKLWFYMLIDAAFTCVGIATIKQEEIRAIFKVFKALLERFMSCVDFIVIK